MYEISYSKLASKGGSGSLRISDKTFSFWKEQWREAGREGKAVCLGDAI